MILADATQLNAAGRALHGHTIALAYTLVAKCIVAAKLHTANSSQRIPGIIESPHNGERHVLGTGQHLSALSALQH